jgi:uncharacterized membrane protein YdjX (TVP38/TMEM64 family)
MTDPASFPPRTNRVWLRLALLGLFFAGLGAVLYATGAYRFLLDRVAAKRFLDSLGPWSFAGFILLQVLQVVAAPIPGEMVGFLGGFLYGPLVGITLSTIGLTLGSWINFSIARAFGRPVVEKFVQRATLERFDFLLHQKGLFLAFMLFLLPGFPKDYLCYILGLGHMLPMEFILVAGAGRLLGTVMLTLGGSFLRRGQFAELGLLAAAALAIVLLLFFYRKEIDRRFHAWRDHRRP